MQHAAPAVTYSHILGALGMPCLFVGTAQLVTSTACVPCQVFVCTLQVRGWRATIKASIDLGKDPLDSFELNFLFTGSPGE